MYQCLGGNQREDTGDDAPRYPDTNWLVPPPQKKKRQTERDAKKWFTGPSSCGRMDVWMYGYAFMYL